MGNSKIIYRFRALQRFRQMRIWNSKVRSFPRDSRPSTIHSYNPYKRAGELDLENSYFSHGQLYVARSRVGKPLDLSRERWRNNVKYCLSKTASFNRMQIFYRQVTCLGSAKIYRKILVQSAFGGCNRRRGLFRVDTSGAQLFVIT